MLCKQIFCYKPFQQVDDNELCIILNTIGIKVLVYFANSIIGGKILNFSTLACVSTTNHYLIRSPCLSLSLSVKILYTKM